MTLSSLITIIKNIFIEEREQIRGEESIKNITEHYKNDLSHLFLDEVWIASEYHETKDLIEDYKYHSHREYRSMLLLYYIELFKLQKDFFSDSFPSIVPVPMHWSRYGIRGFDHVRYMAEWLSEYCDFPLSECLTTAYRPRQSKLDRASRLANKKNAFRMRVGFSKIPETIILIDDVISSWATANACAEVLKNAWAKRVIGWFIASNN